MYPLRLHIPLMGKHGGLSFEPVNEGLDARYSTRAAGSSSLPSPGTPMKSIPRGNGSSLGVYIAMRLATRKGRSSDGNSDMWT